MIKDYFFLAFENLKHRGIRSWLTLLGIFIGVTAVVSLISLGNGLQLAVATQFGVSANQLITVQAGGLSGYGPPGSAVVDPLTTQDADAIERLSSVENTVTRSIESARIEYNENVKYRYVGSMSNNKEDLNLVYTQLDSEPFLGKLLTESDRGKVFLGYNYYANSDDWGGKQITPGKTILVNDREFEVIGILEKEGSLITDNVVYMPEDDVNSLFNTNNTVDVIVVEPRDKNNINKTKIEIEKLLRDRRNVKEGEEDFEVSTPEASLATINSVLSGVQIFIVIIASISIFIGAIGIINTMTTSVLERRKEIGVSKSIGARNEHIFLQFFIESSLLGLIGGLTGAIFGTLIGAAGIYGINIWLGTTLKPHIDFVLISFTLLGSFLIGGIAGIVPAFQAAKQNPVQALRS